MILRAALSALFVSVLAIGGARAADLGGNCCADLEERVAELEATSAKSGNRKMHIVIYGQVDAAYYGITGTGVTHQSGVISNSADPTFLGIMGEATLSKNLKAGFKVEFQWGDRFNVTTANGGFANEVVLRQGIAWVDTLLGKVSIGHGSMASDYAGSVTMANTTVASRMLSLAPGSTVFLFGYDLPFNDVRRDVVRYDSPDLLGFRISGSVANGDTFTNGGVGGPPLFGFANKDAFDIALRYANEIGQFRIGAAIAYRDEQQALSTIPFAGATRSTVWDGSASVMHMPTGLFISGAYGHVTGDVVWGNFDAYHVQGGWEKAIFKDIGTTTIFAEWGEISSDGTGLITGTSKASFTTPVYGIGGVQNFAPLATDVYLDWKHYDTTPIGTPSAYDQIMGGVRVKF